MTTYEVGSSSGVNPLEVGEPTGTLEVGSSSELEPQPDEVGRVSDGHSPMAVSGLIR